MIQIEFDYKNNKTIIQAELTDFFDNVLQIYKNKTNINLENKFFYSNGRKIQKGEIIENIMNESDKYNKSLKILINEKDSEYNSNIIKSKDVICPECKEICRYEIKDYKIKLFGCKNGHTKENIRLNEFDNIQYIDLSKIVCGRCQNKNISETNNNEFYMCNKCKMNLCPLCKSNHKNKNHCIISYETKNYLCNQHKEPFINFCQNCKSDICKDCVKSHKNHELTNYDDVSIDINEIQKNMANLRDTIDKLKENIKENIRKLNKVMENLDLFYNINNNIINNYKKINIIMYY